MSRTTLPFVHITKYKNMKMCTLDILTHLPRSVFSVKQLDLFLWLLRVNNVDYVPGVDGMKDLNKLLQCVCGIDTVGYDGILGHQYVQNSRNCQIHKFVLTCTSIRKILEIPLPRLDRQESGFTNYHLKTRHQ